VYSTYLGGSEIERGEAIAVDPSGTAYVTGETVSGNFPTKNALQPTKPGSEFNSSAFVVKLRDQVGSPRVYMPAIGR
jgi:hypothetical protein